jgi:hypothetical protein
MSAPDPITMISMSLSAASAMSGPVARYYLASARVAFVEATARLRELERSLVAHKERIAAELGGAK